MKRFLTVVFMLGYAMIACGQQALMRHQLRYTHITVTLDSTSSKTIYIGYPDISSLNARVDTTAFGTNIPQYQRQSVVAMGHVFIGVTLDISGVEESDSLYSYIKPYWFNEDKQAWFESSTDISYINFTAPASHCQDAVAYLDWTTAYHYSIQLSNELWSCGGFTFTLGQYAYDNAGSATKAYIDIWIAYQEV